MISKSINRLEYLCDTIPAILLAISEDDFSFKIEERKWSKKEVLGHLIDSATNNHHRFVRGQFEDVPAISYDQDLWNKHNFYQQIDSVQLVHFWEQYNRHLLAMIKLLPARALENKVRTGSTEHSLSFLIADYVAHLEHHLKQIDNY